MYHLTVDRHRVRPLDVEPGVTLVTNMVINAFVPASVTIAKMFVTSFMRRVKTVKTVLLSLISLFR